MALVVNYVLEDPSAVSECANKIKEEPKERGEQDRAEDAVLGDPSAVLECASKIKEELKEKGEQDRAEATVAPFAEDFVLEQDPLNIKKEEDLEDTSLSNLEITNNTKQEAKVTFDGDGAENCNLQDTFSILESTNNVKQEAEITIDDNGVEDYVHEDLLPVSEWTNNIKNEPELTIDKDEMENNDFGQPSSSEWTYNVKNETEAALEVDRHENTDMVSTEYASNTTWSSQIMEKFPSTSRGNVLQKLIHGVLFSDNDSYRSQWKNHTYISLVKDIVQHCRHPYYCKNKSSEEIRQLLQSSNHSFVCSEF
ncbi:uncharacterized protein LOC126108555 isoform X2 [Schistocerca cancellata]|uniref:uncharacterized protein LOC126108555 isoform X2 n=1 Tax=Schistocerca cancellata TaxID=274614 RepID=UPI002119A2AB|nr:uncharacterized protein LOC126108555 isoform X2 [Schistocerca cancellata]